MTGTAKTPGKGGRAAEKAAAEAEAHRAKIADMPEPDRALAERIHAIIAERAPELTPKLYYGQPGWARTGKVVCFFRSGLMDKLRYSTFGVSPDAQLDDDGGVWPTSYALTEPDEAAWQQLAGVIERAGR